MGVPCLFSCLSYRPALMEDSVDIKREELARARKKEELLERMQEVAAELDLGEPQGQNQHGPVYINQYYDLRIDKDPGFGDYRLLLMHKLQPTSSLIDRLRGKLRSR
ncbi:MAG: hypothetical protein KatS3mg057_0427 [Herpetosiphonaceae bacterium]|nr:MAG: hypothetical protein KatS3mg057_0427 [Herpetosiphonaceae bacterium]